MRGMRDAGVPGARTTWLPEPRRDSMMPSDRSLDSASRTVGRETPKREASSLSVGSIFESS